MNKETRNRYSRAMAPVGISLLLLLAACGGSSHSSSSTSTATTTATTRTIGATQKLTTLTVGAYETLVAPTGYSLTMTVDGVQRNIESGVTYTGDIVLAITAEHNVNYMTGTPFAVTEPFRMGLYVEDGGIVTDQSVSSALLGVTYDNTSATGGTITSKGDLFNGIVIGGTTGNGPGLGSIDPYLISKMTLNFAGNGGNDFAGYGAALMTTGSAIVKVDEVNITTDGCVRPAVWAGGTSVLTIENSKIIGKSATAEQEATVKVPMLKEVPWLLGVSGNNRATNVCESAQVTYKNCDIEAESWGALSTDSCTAGATLTAIDCKVAITGTSGYGSYADAAVINDYVHCSFDVPDYVLIVAAGQCGATFEGNANGNTVATSDRFGIMWHKNQGGTVNIKSGTTFTTGGTMFLVKSDVSNTAYPILNVEGATLTPANGVIFHLMESDDAGMNPNGGGPGSDTMWNTSYTVPTVVPVTDTNDTTVINETTVKTTFKDMDVNGDIYNTRWTAGQNLSATFVNANITGRISAGVQANTYVAAGGLITADTRQYLGEETVTVAQVYSNGVIVSLDATSTWTVPGTCYLSSLTIAEGATLKAASGTLKMKVGTSASDLVITEIKAGTYKGYVMLYTE